MSAMAGFVGGGGLGDFAISYGSQRYNWPVTLVTVVIIIVIVQVASCSATGWRAALCAGDWPSVHHLGFEGVAFCSCYGPDHRRRSRPRCWPAMWRPRGAGCPADQFVERPAARRRRRPGRGRRRSKPQAGGRAGIRPLSASGARRGRPPDRPRFAPLSVAANGRRSWPTHARSAAASPRPRSPWPSPSHRPKGHGGSASPGACTASSHHRRPLSQRPVSTSWPDWFIATHHLNPQATAGRRPPGWQNRHPVGRLRTTPSGDAGPQPRLRGRPSGLPAPRPHPPRRSPGRVAAGPRHHVGVLRIPGR